MSCKNDDSDRNIPARVMILERDLTALEARCRECRQETREKLKMISDEISSFGSRVSEDVKKINGRIDALVSYLGSKKRTRLKTKH